MSTANGTAIAGGAIVATLLDTLIAKGVLSKGEVGELIGNAFARLTPLGHSPDVAAARNTLSSLAQMYAGHNG